MRKAILFLSIFLILTCTASAATLKVGTNDQYKTIQKAVDAAQNEDIILVSAGTYKEKVVVKDKRLIFQGAKVGTKYQYPSVYGFEFSWDNKGNVGAGDINGFKITKYGIMYGVVGRNTVRNNLIYSSGISITGQTCSENSIINNQFFSSGVELYESYDNTVTGNKINKAKVGLSLREGATCTKISGNTFSSCDVAVQLYEVPKGMIGNKYVKNKKNIKTGVY